MSVFKTATDALKDFVSGMRASGPLKGLLEPLDCHQISLNLDLANQGRVRGLSDSPDSSQEDFDNVEQRVINEITDTWTTQRQAVSQAVQQFSRFIAEVNIDADLAKLRLSAGTARTDFSNAQQLLNTRIHRLHEASKDALLELAHFKTTHGLQRPARDEIHLSMTWGLLFLCIAIESLANGLFFQEGNDLGLIGGIGIAIMISFINVALAFVVGRFPARYVNFSLPAVRFLALIICALSLSAMLSFHLLIAHFRDALIQSGPGTTNATALAIARASFWSMPTEPSSIYLLLLGTLFAGFSAWKGYSSDDPYPGYGAVSRRARDAEDEYETQRHELLETLTTSRNEVVDLCEATLTNWPIAVRESASAVTQAQALLQDLVTFETSLEQCANSLLTTYRDANSQARSTPPPGHFGERWRLPPHSMLALPPAVLPSDETLQNRLLEVRAIHEEFLDRYESLLSQAGNPESMPASLRSRLI